MARCTNQLTITYHMDRIDDVSGLHLIRYHFNVDHVELPYLAFHVALNMICHVKYTCCFTVVIWHHIFHYVCQYAVYLPECYHCNMISVFWVYQILTNIWYRTLYLPLIEHIYPIYDDLTIHFYIYKDLTIINLLY